MFIKRRQKVSDLDEDLAITRPGVFKHIRAYFFAGILVTAPIGITVYLTWMFLQFVDDRVTALIPAALNPFNYIPSFIPGIDLLKSLVSLIIVIAFFVVIGVFTRNFFGNLIYRASEYVVTHMPVINNIYKTIKQIFETIMTTQSQAFRDVIMLEYPRKGIWSIGFVTGKTEGEIQRITDDEVINVFIPTTPNPTSGFLLFVPRKDVILLDMSVEEAAKLAVSAGIIVPPDRTVEILPEE